MYRCSVTSDAQTPVVYGSTALVDLNAAGPNMGTGTNAYSAVERSISTAINYEYRPGEMGARKTKEV